MCVEVRSIIQQLYFEGQIEEKETGYEVTYKNDAAKVFVTRNNEYEQMFEGEAVVLVGKTDHGRLYIEGLVNDRILVQSRFDKSEGYIRLLYSIRSGDGMVFWTCTIETNKIKSIKEKFLQFYKHHPYLRSVKFTKDIPYMSLAKGREGWG